MKKNNALCKLFKLFLIVFFFLAFVLFGKESINLRRSQISFRNSSPALLELNSITQSAVKPMMKRLASIDNIYENSAEDQQINNENAITERIKEELERVLQIEGVIPSQFEIMDIYQATESSDWPDGYCLEVKSVDEEFLTGEICFFQDGKQNVSELARLDHYTFNSWSPPLPLDEPIGNYSHVVFDELPGEGNGNDNVRNEYRGAFVKDVWIGDFHLPELALENDYVHYKKMLNNILKYLPSSFEKNTNGLQITETQEILRNSLITQLDSISHQAGLNEDAFSTDSWLGAEVTYCFAMYADKGIDTRLCLFRDGADNQPPDVRLQQLRQVNWWWGEIVSEDLISNADGSLLIKDQSSPYTYYLLFVKGEWIGTFDLHIPDGQPHEEVSMILGQNVIAALQNLPDDLPKQKTILLYQDIWENSWYDLDLPDGYILGPIFRFDKFSAPHQFIFREGRDGPVGEISYTQELDYFTRVAENSYESNYFNCDYNGYADYECGRSKNDMYYESISDPNVILALDYNSNNQDTALFYNLGVEGLVAYLQFNDVRDYAGLAEIGKSLAAVIQESRDRTFVSWDEKVENEIWGCFPADNEMQLSDFMPAYIRSIQYSSDGFIYQMNYFDQHQPVAQTKIVYQDYPHLPSKFELFKQGPSVRAFSEIGNHIYYDFADANSFDEDIQFHLLMAETDNIIKLSSKVLDVGIFGKYFPYEWLNDPSNTYVQDIYTDLAIKMNDCLAGNTGIDLIKVPGEINENVVDTSYLRELLVVSDDLSAGTGTGFLSGEPAYLNLDGNSIYLELWPSRELTEPLTYAIYNEKYDTVLYLQQNKYVLTGDHIYARLAVDRQRLFEGDYVLLIWNGDTLIGYRPISIYATNEGDQ